MQRESRRTRPSDTDKESQVRFQGTGIRGGRSGVENIFHEGAVIVVNGAIDDVKGRSRGSSQAGNGSVNFKFGLLLRQKKVGNAIGHLR